MRSRAKSPLQHQKQQQAMVLSRGELAACLALVLYFLYVLTTEGYNFCQRLVGVSSSLATAAAASPALSCNV